VGQNWRASKAEARAWLMAVACTKPVDLGYPEELWATRTLALHARKHGPEAGHPCLAMLGRGTVSKLLTGAELRPHNSKETQAYLKTRPNRFEFVFTPKHGSWLNLVEGFFAKMTKTILRGIRVASKAELKARIMRYLQDLNADPVVFRWRYKLEEESVS
jgi:transposase